MKSEVPFIITEGGKRLETVGLIQQFSLNPRKLERELQEKYHTSVIATQVALLSFYISNVKQI